MTTDMQPSAFESLFRLSQQLLSATNTDAVCTAAVSTAAGLSSADYVALMLLDESDTQLTIRAVHGWEPEKVGRPGPPLGRASQCGYAIMQREPILSPNY